MWKRIIYGIVIIIFFLLPLLSYAQSTTYFHVENTKALCSDFCQNQFLQEIKQDGVVAERSIVCGIEVVKSQKTYCLKRQIVNINGHYITEKEERREINHAGN